MSIKLAIYISIDINIAQRYILVQMESHTLVGQTQQVFVLLFVYAQLRWLKAGTVILCSIQTIQAIMAVNV